MTGLKILARVASWLLICAAFLAIFFLTRPATDDKEMTPYFIVLLAMFGGYLRRCSEPDPTAHTAPPNHSQQNNPMKSLCLLAVALLLVGCDSSPQTSGPTQAVTRTVAAGASINLTTVDHDGCEYVLCTNNRETGIAHKGNCKYCAQRMKGQTSEGQFETPKQPPVK